MCIARSHSASPERKKHKKEKKEKKKKKKKKHRKKHKKEKKEEKVSKSSGGNEKKGEEKRCQVLPKPSAAPATQNPTNPHVQEGKAKEGWYMKKGNMSFRIHIFPPKS